MSEKQELDARTREHLTIMLKGYLENVEQVKSAVEGLSAELERAHNTQTGMEKSIWELRDILDLPQLDPPQRVAPPEGV